MAAGAFLVGVGVSRRQHGEVVRRPAKLLIQLVLGVHPRPGHAGDDRMVRLADDDLERVLGTVGTGRARRFIADFLAVGVVIHVRPGLLVAISPPAQTDHAVEGVPVAEAVVGGVDDD